MSTQTLGSSSGRQGCTLTFPSLTRSSILDLKARLRSNHRTSYLETPKISELLSTARDDLARCETEVSRLQSLILSLDNKRREISRRVQEYESLLSPIRRLPEETLRLIFQECCSGDECLYAKEVPEALKLGMVCAYWRKVMLSSPAAWSAFMLAPEPGDSPLDMRLLDAYLERSRSMPLEIELDSLQAELDYERLLYPQAVEKCIQHCHRWADVMFQVSPNIFQLEAFASVRSNLPRLQRLRLNIDHADPSTVIDYFEFAPQLYSIALLGSPVDVRLPWSQITYLWYSADDPVDFVHRLSLLTSLEDMLLQFSTPFSTEGIQVTTSNLNAFEIDCSELSAIASVLDILTLPSLRTLTIHSRMPPADGPWPLDAIANFLSRSHCTITSFTIINQIIKESELIDLLRLLPSVTKLQLISTPSTSVTTLLQTLNLWSSSPFSCSISPLLPHLESFDLRLDMPSFPTAEFAGMVTSRWLPDADEGAVSCLKSVVLKLSDTTVSLNDLVTLGYLAHTGLHILIRDANGLVPLPKQTTLRDTSLL